MTHSSRLMYLAAAALALAPAAALAQSSPQTMAPMPASSGAPATSASPAAAPSPMESSGGTMGSPAPAASPAASGSGSSSGSSSSSGGSTTNGNGGTSGGNNGNHNGQIKKIKSGSLSLTQVRYALTHPVQEAKQLKSMKSVSFDNLRVYRLPTSLKGVLHVSEADTQAVALAVLGGGVQLAQTTPALPTTNGNNSPIQYLRDVLANINVSNALNNLNVLNNSNVNVNVALQNVLNNNKISIGQVVGLYIGGGGIITTITK